MFGKSVFESVLERLRVEEESASEDGVGAVNEPSRGPLPAFAVFGGDHMAASGRSAASAYREFADDEPMKGEVGQRDEPAIDVAPASPPHLMRTTPDEVAADLGLRGSETGAELAAIRRAFARDNHPDAAPEALRANATRRMMIANMLIDETLRRMQAEAALGLRR
ncbi:hypothetical protein SAMN05892877_109173 [Rhizobium subbaraonis]|uniref:Uncharacterized protein n=1 Tax=Rhizobium subbaraonis TaxID=908946 RepID=A0A285UJH1_9HYPH|nr:hypothetical protein [Rhizobium subbaraonis]SOC41999.1 hypothetical protein SAMN05892877_109173 [Rhizobium subbaraonis]